MTTTASVLSTTAPQGATTTPGVGRRLVLTVAAFLTCALPVIFAFNISRMLLTGVEADHRFHQATGQGLVLCALWLGALLPLVRAGWRGERPSTAAGYRHLAFVLVGAACAVVAPGGGAPILMAIIAVPGVLLWAALPQRPRLGGRLEIDPVLTPVALLVTAVLAPYAVDQLALQNDATTGYHSENPHFFDMAWVTGVVMVLALLGAHVRRASGLFWWVAGACVAIGTAGLAFGEPATWSAGVLGMGLVGLAAALVSGRRNRP